MSAEYWGEPIHVYTREQAIEDGFLVGVDDGIAREAGWRHPVALTLALQAVLAKPSRTESYAGRLWDVLSIGNMNLRSWVQRMVRSGTTAATAPATVDFPLRLKFSGRNYELVVRVAGDGILIGLRGEDLS